MNQFVDKFFVCCFRKHMRFWPYVFIPTTYFRHKHRFFDRFENGFFLDEGPDGLLWQFIIQFFELGQEFNSFFGIQKIKSFVHILLVINIVAFIVVYLHDLFNLRFSKNPFKLVLDIFSHTHSEASFTQKPLKPRSLFSCHFILIHKIVELICRTYSSKKLWWFPLNIRLLIIGSKESADVWATNQRHSNREGLIGLHAGASQSLPLFAQLLAFESHGESCCSSLTVTNAIFWFCQKTLV